MTLPHHSLAHALRERLAFAARTISPAARQELVAFLHAQKTADGGYRGRGDGSDLYYTSFALAALSALGEPDESASVRAYLHAFLRRGTKTLVDHVCLLRSLHLVCPDNAELPALRARLEEYRSADGGYAPVAGARRTTAYAPYLVLLGYEQELAPDAQRIRPAVCALRAQDGGYGNDDAAAGSAPATAAGLLLELAFGCTPHQITLHFLRGLYAGGGWLAVPGAPVADLLSTATVLHALRSAGADMSDVRAASLAFVEARWDAGGGFCAHALDTRPDCEYTFYGLLALGSLLL